MKETTNIYLNEVAIETPFDYDVFNLTDDEKINKIEHHFAEIMHTLGLNLFDDSLCETPKRVAKMFVKEIFSGLNPHNKPDISLFENKYGYKKMLIEKDITLYSTCEHHFVPIIGKVHVAYIPDQQVIGLSKINRLVQYYAKRPQVQERLTVQISEALKDILQHNDVAVVVQADHLCVASRGINDTNSKTFTAEYSGQFENDTLRQEFLSHIQNK
jgi:GTP cyclohydrolase I